MTADEVMSLPPKYLLTEEEEAKIPSREELHKRYLSLPEETLAAMDEVRSPSQELLLGNVFKADELAVFLKGERAAFALLDELQKKMNDYSAWDAARDYVWTRCFRRADLQGIYEYPPRHRIGEDLF